MITVERLRADDARFPQVFSWHWREWSAGDPAADERDWRQRLATRCSAAGIPFTLVAELDGAPAGCVSVCADDRDARYADHGPWLSGMVVPGPARNLGVGRALLAAAAAHARDEGASELWVWTAEAGPFYARCGYEHVHRRTAPHDHSVLRLVV